MGKIVDRLAGCLLLTAGAFALFLRAFDSIPAAIGLTLACGALLRHALRGRSSKFPLTVRDARAILLRWAMEDDDRAKSELAALLGQDADSLVYISKHPTLPLSAGEVFGAWKRCRDAERCILVTTGRADAKARALAAELRAPRMEVLDGPRLIPRIRRSTLKPPERPRMDERLQRLRRSLALLPTLRPWRSSARLGLFLFPVYLFTGRAVYLFLSVGALFLAGVSRRFQRAQ